MFDVSLTSIKGMLSLSETVWAGILGGLVGSVTMGFVQFYLNKKQVELQTGNEKKVFLKSVKTELHCLRERYMLVGEIIEKDLIKNGESQSEPPDNIGITETVSNYFVVFDNNSNRLGLLDPATASNIVRAYILGKAMLDSLIYYSKLWYEFLGLHFQNESGGNRHQKELKHKYSILTDYYNGYIKNEHKKLLKAIDDAVGGIDVALAKEK